MGTRREEFTVAHVTGFGRDLLKGTLSGTVAAVCGVVAHKCDSDQDAVLAVALAWGAIKLTEALVDWPYWATVSRSELSEWSRHGAQPRVREWVRTHRSFLKIWERVRKAEGRPEPDEELRARVLDTTLSPRLREAVVVASGRRLDDAAQLVGLYRRK